MQDDIFSQSEADQWFDRNQHALSDSDRLRDDPVLKLLHLSGLHPCSVLEVGASNGYRLDAIQRQWNCSSTAVEPSGAAIQDGIARFPKVEFLKGTAAALPIQESERFDLVIVSFVLHWVDRSSLFRTVAELDRVLAEGGCLIIADFYPSQPVKTVYHHLPGQEVFTYKQDYTRLFTSSGLYEKIMTMSFDHDSRRFSFDSPPEHRAAVTALKKSVKTAYLQILPSP